MLDLKGTILVIDDESLISDLLADEEYAIINATDPMEGVALAGTKLPDLILLDIAMPGMDGFEVCRMLKADSQTRSIPIIFITGLSSAEHETRGLEAGGADYIIKPVNPSILFARVRIQMELKKQRDYLEALSTMDSLTGVYNRRWFDQSMDREWRRCGRAKTPLSLVMIDIDFFKAYNDAHGHLAGDDCLKMVARQLLGVPRRGGDTLSRFGGEEFVAILPDTPYQFLNFMADKFRRSVEEAAFAHGHSAVSDVVTVSVGAAVVVPDSSGDFQVLIEKADEMLYRAKNEGRNRVRATVIGS